MRTAVTKKLQDPNAFKQQLLAWSQAFREVAFLDSNDYPQRYASYDCLLAVEGLTALQTDFANAFEQLREYQQITKDWLFGYLSYDLKNDTEALASQNFDGLHFPDLFFFQPKKIFLIKGNELQILYLRMCEDEMEDDFLAIVESPKPRVENRQPPHGASSPVKIQQRIPKPQYLAKVGQMLEHIHRGDIYEANFCMEFYARQQPIDPLETFQKLNGVSTPPFAVFFKNNAQFLLSASPERYLRKQNDKIISQPIKGTAKRGVGTVEDEAVKNALLASPKERAENIMIVDLVRNDLSRTAAKGSVQVEELCGLHSFKQVHHLISTVVSQIHPKYGPVDVIAKSFPMGSMTGAPKISAMEIIEKLEESKRGLYSGAVGYFTPTGDFDFNVVIRSILYSEIHQYVSFSVGSAITAESDPEQEYEECLLKAKAIFAVLGGSI